LRTDDQESTVGTDWRTVSAWLAEDARRLASGVWPCQDHQDGVPGRCRETKHRARGRSQVTSTGFSINNEAIEGCRSTVSAQSGQIGGLGDDFTENVPASAFGMLPASGAIAAAVAAIEEAGRKEFAAAETLLNNVDRALDSIYTSVIEAEKDNVYKLSTSN
jgi:hypothetical protein